MNYGRGLPQCVSPALSTCSRLQFPTQCHATPTAPGTALTRGTPRPSRRRRRAGPQRFRPRPRRPRALPNCQRRCPPAPPRHAPRGPPTRASSPPASSSRRWSASQQAWQASPRAASAREGRRRRGSRLVHRRDRRWVLRPWKRYGAAVRRRRWRTQRKRAVWLLLATVRATAGAVGTVLADTQTAVCACCRDAVAKRRNVIMMTMTMMMMTMMMMMMMMMTAAQLPFPGTGTAGVGGGGGGGGGAAAAAAAATGAWPGSCWGVPLDPSCARLSNETFSGTTRSGK